MFQAVFLPTLAIFFSVSVIVHVNYYFTISELKQCQWRPAVVTWDTLSACPLMFTWTWRCWADSSLCWRRGFPLLALALPRCLVMLSKLTLLMLLAASKGNKWFETHRLINIYMARKVDSRGLFWRWECLHFNLRTRVNPRLLLIMMTGTCRTTI